MQNETIRNIRLGIFVIAGMFLLIIALYYIGANQNLFGPTIRVSANFHDVNGLTPGNNVRYSGINIGTVESVELTTDSNIRVVMLVKNDVKNFIRKNAVASIGTDGLMGNRIVNINSVNMPEANITDGDVLKTREQIETDEMIRTLNKTNEDISAIATNLRDITDRINSPNSLWSILLDTIVAENLKHAIVNIKITSQQSAIITGNLAGIIDEIKAGRGTVGALLTDSTMANALQQTIVNIKIISDTLAEISGDLSKVSQSLKNGEGALGTILYDTNFVHNLNKSMENIRSGTQGFDDNMEALKHNFLLRSYFRKLEKQSKANE